MPLSIFRIRTLAGANVVGLLLGASIFADFFLLTLYVQNVLGYSAAEDRGDVPRDGRHGGPRRRPRRSGCRRGSARRPVMVVGLVLNTGRLIWYAQIPVDGSLRAATCSAATSCSASASRSHSSRSRSPRSRVSSRDEAGLASGLLNTAQQVGGALGVAIATTVAISHVDASAADRRARRPAALTAATRSPSG